MDAAGRAFRHVQSGVHFLSQLMGLLAGLCIVVITVAMLCEVFFRYFLGRSFLGVIELVEILMAFIFFGLMSYTQLQKGHLRLTLFTELMSKRVQSFLELGALFLILIFISIIAWQAWDEALISFERRQIRFGAIEYPLWPGKLAAATAIAVMALQVLVDLIDRTISVASEGSGGPMGRDVSEADSV